MSWDSVILFIFGVFGVIAFILMLLRDTLTRVDDLVRLWREVRKGIEELRTEKNEASRPRK